MIFSGVTIAIVFWAVLPIVSEMERAGLSIGEQREKIAGYEKRIAAAREFAAFAKEEKNNLEKINNVFVDSKLPLEFINFLEAEARRSSVDIKFSSSMVQQKTAQEQLSIIIKASVAGGREEVLRFLKNIEDGPYLVQIQNASIELNSRDRGGAAQPDVPAIDSGITKADILIKAYAK